MESGKLGAIALKGTSVDKHYQIREAITFNFQLYTFNFILAGMMELADMRDLGAVTSGKVFEWWEYYGKQVSTF